MSIEKENINPANQNDDISRFQPHFLEYWNYVKGAIDENGWVYSKEVPYLLDAYFETNTKKEIEFQKMYEYVGDWRGYRWRPKSIVNLK